MLDEEVNATNQEEEQYVHIECEHPDYIHVRLKHVVEGDAVAIHVCAAKFEEAEERIKDSNPAWKEGTVNFRMAVGHLLSGTISFCP